MAETCANCGAMIGNLETPHVWRDNIVCATCHARLSAPVSPPRPAPSPPPPPPPPTPAPAMLDGNLVRCEACGHAIASGTTKCPSCGQARGFDIGRFIVLFVFVMFILWLLGQAASTNQ